ncbi:MAG: adenylate/guanylate cyclase domain-containing protein [Gammaproteobacteria bacterium]|nr:adenylate/guanylate cyclase domain-containing protein [Gammaproteobacteria bacterium]
MTIFLVFVLHIRGFFHIGLIEQLENLSYDMRINLTMPNTVDDRIVIVDIDEKSIGIEGQWPWSRDRLAQMVDNLFDVYDAKVVGFDIAFPEPDANSGLGLLNDLITSPLGGDEESRVYLESLRPSLETDRLFGESMRGRNVVLGYVFHELASDDDVNELGALPAASIRREQNDTSIRFRKALGYTGNVPALANSARAAGFFDNPTVGSDGVYRRVPVLQEYDGDLYESLALALVRAATNRPDIQFTFFSGARSKRDNLDLEWLRIADLNIPVDEDIALLVPYRGRQLSFPYVPAATVIAGDEPIPALTNAIVLVGTSAPGLFDLRVTPVAERYFGVEVHANIVSGILDQRVKHHPEYVRGIHATILFLIAALLTWVLSRASVILGTVTAIGIAVVIFFANLALWEHGNFVIPLASPLLFILILFITHMIYGFFIESRGKRQLSQLFGQYVPPELVEEMDTNPEDFSMDGESRDMTVLFSDVRGFTSISESLEPKELTAFMNEFLTPITRIIHENRGTIDKYMGDAVMAFWGAPLNDPDHAKHAVLAAMGMLDALDKLKLDFKKRGWPEINVGIGINTGMMSVGNMGSEFRMAYTVMGDAVNLGSRLEGLTKQYGVRIIASEYTREVVPEVQFLELDRVRVKGKEQPVAIYEPLGLRASLDKSVKGFTARHKQALMLYRKQDWDNAEREFFSLQQAQTDRLLYKMYLERVAYFRKNPPGESWDGVFTHTTK